MQALLRVFLAFLVISLLGIFAVPPSLSAPPTQNIAGFYYLLTGFNGGCIDGGGGNVAVSGDIVRLAYLPAVNAHTATFTNPPSASAFSISAQGSAQAGAPGVFYFGYTSLSGPAPLTVTITIDSTANGAAIGSSTLRITCAAVGATPLVQLSNTYNSSTVSIFDGRLNTDLAAPVIVYDNPLRLFVFDPETEKGVQILSISATRITDIGIPDQATVLASSSHPFSHQAITVYRLPSGEFQLSTAYGDGKPYIFVWNEDATARYYLAR